MTLATRCTSCGTTFKVVQDQLKVSGGWVRCGRCAEVFNAIDGLFEFRASGGAAPATVAEAPAEALQLETGAATPVTAEDEAPALPDGPRDMVAEALPADTPAAAEMAGPPAPMPVVTEPASAAAPTLASFGAPAGPTVTPENRPPGTLAAERAAPAAAVAAAEQAPAFVRKADRAARWRRPGVRRLLAASSLILLLALALQAALVYRDAAAARWPATLPLLAQACAWAGCKVEPLRRIGALSVDSSGLQQLPGTQIYRLSIVLRNRSDLALMLPSFDLTLTDARGEVVARRTLTAAELGTDARTIRAGAELPLEASLNTGDRPISGYTIETFYP